MQNIQVKVMENQTRKRDEIIDIFRGIVIFLIVLGHLHWPIWFLRLFLGFHISLFFVLTGFFIAEVVSRYKTVDYLKLKIQKVIRVYFATLFFQFGVLILFDLKHQQYIFEERLYDFSQVLLLGSNAILGSAGYSSYLWFLPLFFFFSILLFVLYKKNSKNIFLAGVFLCLLCMIILHLSNLRVYDSSMVFYNVDKIVFALLLGFMGQFFYRKRNFFEDNAKLLFPLSLLVILISFAIWPISLRQMEIRSVSLFLFYAFIGFVFVFSFSKLIVESNKKVVENMKRRLIYWGRNTFGIYIFHTFVNQIVPLYMGIPMLTNFMYNFVLLVFTFSTYSLLGSNPSSKEVGRLDDND
jgi:fucose 4-O-acetylase-like acetyltransferase